MSVDRTHRRSGRRRGDGPPLALRHTVLIVANGVGVEFHLDHRVDERRGHHRVMDEGGLTAWIADVGDARPSFRVGSDCPCQHRAPARVHPPAVEPHG